MQIANEYITSGEAARSLGLSQRYVLALADAGEIPHIRTTYGRIFRLADVQALAAERRAHPPKRGGDWRARLRAKQAAEAEGRA